MQHFDAMLAQTWRAARRRQSYRGQRERQGSGQHGTDAPLRHSRERCPRVCGVDDLVDASDSIGTDANRSQAIFDFLAGILLKGRLDGIAARVPVPDGSVVDLFVELEKRISAEDVHAAIKSAAESKRMKGILQLMASPVVLSDVIGNSHSSIFDPAFTSVTCG